MKRLLITLTILLAATGYALAGGIVNADPHSKIAIEGYDPVAFFTESRAMKGNPSIASEYEGYNYLFASEANKALFDKQPEKYVPAYGGYCAYGVSLGYLFPVDIDTWEIVDGRLVLQYSEDVKREFAKNEADNFKKAESNWPNLVEQFDR